MLVYETGRDYFPRLDLRPFDARSAERLSADQRARDEAELFGALPQWNINGAEREKRWRQMASEGFELAHIALQVFQPERATVHPLNAPMQRLEALAVGGDTGAMCMMTAVVDNAGKQATADFRAQARRWLTEGATRGHPECQLQLGRRLLLGLDAHAVDERAGLALDMQARRAGYTHDLDGLLHYFQRRWSSSPVELTRLYCWLSVDAQSRSTDGPQRMLESLRDEARRNGSTALLELAASLEARRFSMQVCIEMGAT